MRAKKTEQRTDVTTNQDAARWLARDLHELAPLVAQKAALDGELVTALYVIDELAAVLQQQLEGVVIPPVAKLIAAIQTTQTLNVAGERITASVLESPAVRVALSDRAKSLATEMEAFAVELDSREARQSERARRRLLGTREALRDPLFAALVDAYRHVPVVRSGAREPLERTLFYRLTELRNLGHFSDEAEPPSINQLAESLRAIDEAAA
jgi:hypothetical protein